MFSPAILMPGRKLPDLVYLGSTFSTADASSYTFSGLNFGPAHKSRVIAFGAFGPQYGGSAFGTCSVAGVAAALVVAAGNTGAWYPSGLFTAAVPAGGFGNIVVGFNTTVSKCALSWWAMYNLASPTAFSSAEAENGSPVSVSINVPARGRVIAFNGCANWADTTWTGVIENADLSTGEIIPTDGGTAGFAAGSISGLAAQTGRSIVAAGTVPSNRLVAASWA